MEKGVKICPECGCTTLVKDDDSIMKKFGYSNNWICLNCYYEGESNED